MMSNPRFAFMGSLAALGLLVGCDSEGGGGTPSLVDSGAPPRPLTSAEATAAINQRVDDIITGLANATARIDSTGSTAAVSDGLGAAVGSSSACPASTTTAGDSADDVPQSTTDGLDDFLRNVAKEAQEHVFRAEFVESEDGKQVVYKMDPGAACDTDATCLQKLTQYPMRFAVTANSDDTLDVAMLVGEARHNPGTAVLAPTKVSARVNLAVALEVIRLYADAEDQPDLPDRLAGVVAAAIEKRAENDFVISASLLERFELLVGQAKGKPVAVTVQPSDPALQLSINSATNTLGYAANLGATDVQVAGAAVCDDQCGASEQTGTFSGHLGGLSSQFALTQGATELTFSALGLGADTAFVALNGDPLGTLDLNANSGRKLSVSFKKVAGGTLVTFDPALDIKLAIMLNKLSESLRVDMPDWLESEIFDVMLGGAAPSSVLIPTPTCDIYGTPISKNQIQVAAGTLSLDASSLAAPVTVAAGMCLLPVDGAADDAHPFSQVQAGVCQ